MKRKDLLLAPLLEAALITTAAGVGFLVHQPLIFASLGPTAYEMVEQPNQPSAKPYNILAGHAIGILCAFAALAITHAAHAAPVSAAGVPLLRVWSALLASLLTVFVALLAKATQPAAVSTTLLVALGILQTWHDGLMMMTAVVLITLLGTPIRIFRQRQAEAS